MPDHGHHQLPPAASETTPHSGHRAADHIAAGHHEHIGHGGAHYKHAGHTVAMFRDKFSLSLTLPIPTLIWGHMLPRALGNSPPSFPGAHLIPPVLGVWVFLCGG